MANLRDLAEHRRLRSAAEAKDDAMKYMITWSERAQGSAIEYENAQKRILDVFRRWEAPANFKIELFVIRVGDWGGYMLADCDDPITVHKFCSMLPAFEFQARPVIPIEDAVRGELEVMAWRDGLNIDRRRPGVPPIISTPVARPPPLAGEGDHAPIPAQAGSRARGGEGGRQAQPALVRLQ